MTIVKYCFKAMMNLLLSQPWVLSANFHDGAVVAAYPHNFYKDDNKEEGIEPTQDEAMFQQLAKTYAKNHGTMTNKLVEILLMIC